MADMKEKLVELLTDNLPRVGNLPKCDNPLQYTMDEIVERIAEHLIAHGVTVHGDKDINVPTKCDYCQADRDGYRKALGAFFLANPFNGSLWQIKTTRTKPRQIFFCPMCGRKLTEPPKGE